MQFETFNIIIGFSIAILIAMLTLQRRCWLFVWQLNGIRGLLQQPVLWALLLLYVEPNSIMEATRRWRCFFSRPLAIIVGIRILLYIDDPHTIEQVLNAHECLNKTFLQNGFFARKGLLHATGQQWRTRRKQLNPAFSHNILLSFFNIFNAVGNQLQCVFTENLQATSTSQAMTTVSYEDVEDLLSRAALEVSCLTTLGTDTNFTTNDAAGIANAYNKLLEISALRVMKPWMQCDRLFRLMDRKTYEIHVKSNKLVEQFVNDIVQRKHKASLAKNGQTTAAKSATMENSEGSDDFGVSVDNGSSPHSNGTAANKKYNEENETMQKRIFIEQIFHLATLGELTLEDILNETHAMILVSFETVSNSLLIALLLLAMHPECQQKLRNEITTICTNRPRGFDEAFNGKGANDATAAAADAVFPNTNNINVTQLQQMKYLDMIVNESLRLLTTVPINLRHVSCDFRLHLGLRANKAVASASTSVLVPRDTIIVVDTFNMQRDVSHWGPTAQQFEPELHFASNATWHSYAFIPFSKGLRTCIGKRYSMLLLKVFLVKLISSFEFRTQTHLAQLRFVQGISLKLYGAEKITFQIRQLATETANNTTT